MMLKSSENWALPIAMLVDTVGYPLSTTLSLPAPYPIFTMLLLTFCKASPRDLKPKPLHIQLLPIQIGEASAAYLLLYRFDKIVTEGVMVCVICPTATVVAVIISKLGGGAASLTTYTLIADIGVAIAVPILFPLVEVHPDVTSWKAFFVVLSKMFPLSIHLSLATWLLSKCLSKVHRKLLGYCKLAFYLQVISLAIVTAQTLYSPLNDPADGFTEIMVAIGALAACCLQFFLSKTIGSIYNDHVSGGQALGQKSTILAIWMTHTYLSPLSTVTPGSYVLWQNIINSWQLQEKRKI